MYRFNRVVCLIFSFLCFAGFVAGIGARAQGSGVPAHTIVTVEPHKGSTAPVVNKEDVLVYEGKDRDTVTDWVPAQGDHAALEFFILIDDSSNTSLGTQLQDIRHFIENQPESAKIGLAYMQNGTAQIVQNPTIMLS